ncbi:hypothetical protein SAMN06273572_11011 [Monaibacterium marinum]|uniref:Metallo-beta-lactamase superfamily protein n=1 Tax=Pontivivens marinum TaxID=1690039 RepID=A0A2C9CVP9_9RHOB|nr:hypothetical protein [Monaibacterium marinum]SOH95342.1 hypothetical protein SAMN06273572_11011 [Monaibacterium marinum]
MATKISAFEPVPDMPGLFTAIKNNLRCTAVLLQTGQVCLFSPVSGLSDAAKSSLDEIGEVAFLFAPNGYHNGGLVEYAATFPAASLAAPPVMHKRLTDRTGLAFDGIEALRDSLLTGMRLEGLNGLKNGETWVIAQIDGRCLWHVVDAFGGQPNKDMKVGRDIRPNTVFPTFGMKDRAVYLAHLKALLGSDTPDMMLPCHGALTVAADIPQQIAGIYPDLNDA